MSSKESQKSLQEESLNPTLQVNLSKDRIEDIFSKYYFFYNLTVTDLRKVVRKTIKNLIFWIITKKRGEKRKGKKRKKKC